MLGLKVRTELSELELQTVWYAFRKWDNVVAELFRIIFALLLNIWKWSFSILWRNPPKSDKCLDWCIPHVCVHFYISTSLVFRFLCFLFWFMAMNPFCWTFMHLLYLKFIKLVLHWLVRQMCVGFPDQMKMWNNYIVESFASYVRRRANRSVMVCKP